MKKIICVLLIIFGMMSSNLIIYAASSGSCSISGKNTVTVGSTVTLTANFSASKIYMLKGTVSSGNSSILSGSGSIYKKADLIESPDGFSSYSKSITFTAKSVGTAVVSFIPEGANCLDVNNGKITFSSGSITINVVAKSTGGSSGGSSGSSGGSSGSSSGSTNNATTKTPDSNLSKDNTLASLTVSEGTLTPAFSASVNSYSINLTSDITKLTIDAKATDSKATVSGTGEKEIKIGENSFTVEVKAENGDKKTYTVKVIVTEKPTQFLTYNDQELGIINNLDSVTIPEGFEKTSVQIDDKDVTALKSETLGLTLLLLQNDQETVFYIFDGKEINGKFETLSLNSKRYIILPIEKDLKGVEDLTSTTVTIGEMELSGWKFEDKTMENYNVVYLMNDKGEKSLYSYETSEATLQKYVAAITTQTDYTLTYVLIGTTGLFAISSIVLLIIHLRFKKRSISAIKSYYDSKNQDI